MKAVKQTLDERCNETIEEIYKIAIKLIIETIAEGYGFDAPAGESAARQQQSPAGGGGGGEDDAGRGGPSARGDSDAATKGPGLGGAKAATGSAGGSATNSSGKAAAPMDSCEAGRAGGSREQRRTECSGGGGGSRAPATRLQSAARSARDHHSGRPIELGVWRKSAPEADGGEAGEGARAILMEKQARLLLGRVQLLLPLLQLPPPLPPPPQCPSPAPQPQLGPAPSQTTAGPTASSAGARNLAPGSRRELAQVLGRLLALQACPPLASSRSPAERPSVAAAAAAS